MDALKLALKRRVDVAGVCLQDARATRDALVVEEVEPADAARVLQKVGSGLAADGQILRVHAHHQSLAVDGAAHRAFHDVEHALGMNGDLGAKNAGRHLDGKAGRGRSGLCIELVDAVGDAGLGAAQRRDGGLNLGERVSARLLHALGVAGLITGRALRLGIGQNPLCLGLSRGEKRRGRVAHESRPRGRKIARGNLYGQIADRSIAKKPTITHDGSLSQGTCCERQCVPGSAMREAQEKRAREV